MLSKHIEAQLFTRTCPELLAEPSEINLQAHLWSYWCNLQPASEMLH